MNLSQDTIERFFSLMDRGPGCWEWLGSKDAGGYGKMRIGNRKAARAHRIAWAIAHGDPGTMLVCHHCDNPSCVRLDHLFLGTALDNNRDRQAKGRPNNAPRGERNTQAKLTEQQALQVAELYRTGQFRQRDLAEMFGVSQSAVQLLLSGKNWRHSGVMPVQGMRSAPKRSRRKLSDEQRAALLDEYRSGGVSQTALAERYGVSQAYVSQAVRAT